MGGIYPPGVTAGHPHFNPPDREHEHHFEPVDGMNPIFEDGAAIFVEECRWRPQKYVGSSRHGDHYESVGPPCGEERRIRCELVRLEHGPETFKRSNFENQGWWDLVEPALVPIEGLNNKSEKVTIEECDPDPESGEVVVLFGPYRYRYASGYQENREAD